MKLNRKTPSSQRYYGTAPSGRCRVAVMQPVSVVPFLQGEGGLVTQETYVDVDPVQGRLDSQMTLHVESVFVPMQAIHHAKFPDLELAGNDEKYRIDLLAEEALFGLEEETDISKHLDVNPASIGGVTKVSETVRIGHNVAVNFLRRSRYHLANEIDIANTGVTPALLSSTVLQRFQGVLNPDDRVNGAVELSGSALVSGYVTGSDVTAGTATKTGYNSAGELVSQTGLHINDNSSAAPYTQMHIDNDGLHVDLSQTGGNLTLSDFYIAENINDITKEMGRVVKENPEIGQDMIVRAFHGLKVDTGRFPFKVYDREVVLDRSSQMATDGAALLDDVMRTDLGAALRYSVPIPRTEFGGLLFTFVTVKPDEVFQDQPCPILSRPWAKMNFMTEEMRIDPERVVVRDLYSDCDVGEEDTEVMHVGPNHMFRDYSTYGHSRATDPTTVENKSSVYVYNLPLSVDPDNIVYPEDFPQYPWTDQESDVVAYTQRAMAVIQTSIPFGPTPEERLEALTDQLVGLEDEEVVE